MKGYQISSYVDPFSIKIGSDVPMPTTVKDDDVIVEVMAAGLNFFDILQIQGRYQHQPPFPWVAGSEFAGIISPTVKMPPDCTLKVGDRVFGASQGAFAQQVVCSWKSLRRIPPRMTFEEAASLTVTWPTAYEALVGRANVKAGDWVLVHAAAGGVGLIAVQIAKALGAKVIATAGSKEKLNACRGYGKADELIDYTDPNWQEQVLRITNKAGVDIVFDPVGLVLPSLKVIAWKGRIVVVGFAAGSIEKIPMNLVLLKNISLVGLHWGAYTKFEPNHIHKVWDELLKMYEEGVVKPVIFPEIYQFDALARGLKDIAERKTWGKAVLSTNDSEASRAKL